MWGQRGRRYIENVGANEEFPARAGFLASVGAKKLSCVGMGFRPRTASCRCNEKALQRELERLTRRPEWGASQAD